MTTPREELATLVADVVAEHFERLRGDLFAKMLELRTPRFTITPKGELYVDGELAGDVRPVFESIAPRIAQDMLAALNATKPEDPDDGPG